MFAYGFNALIMALFFQELGYSDDLMGIFFTMTLLGDVLLSLFLTLIADQLGRRRILFGGSALMVVSGAAFAFSNNYWVLLVAAVFGVISPSGNEIGPFRAIEESTLAHLTTPDTRPQVLTWYIVTATLGTSSGLVVCGNLIDYLQNEAGWTASESYHAMFWIYSAMGIINMAISCLLSRRCEAELEQKHPATEGDAFLADDSDDEQASPKVPEKPVEKKSIFAQISKESRPILYKLCMIMSLDSFSSGMAAYSLINLYMDRKFHLPKGKLGVLLTPLQYFTPY
jgi:MFS family permease